MSMINNSLYYKNRHKKIALTAMRAVRAIFNYGGKYELRWII